MKRHITGIVAIFVTIAIIFSACSASRGLSDNKSISNSQQFRVNLFTANNDKNKLPEGDASDKYRYIPGRRYSMGAGMSEEDYNRRPWTYNGEALEFNFRHENKGDPIRQGVLIVANGYPVTYSVSGKDATYMNMVELDTDSTIIRRVSFQPVNVKKDQIAHLHISFMFAPDIIPFANRKTGGLLGEQQIDTGGHLEIHSSADAPKIGVTSDGMSISEIAIPLHMRNKNNDEFRCFRLNDNYLPPIPYIQVVPTESIRLRYLVIGDIGLKYRVFVMLDHQPWMMDGKYVCHELTGVREKAQEIICTIPYDVACQYDNIYLLLVPLAYERDWVFLRKTRSDILVRRFGEVAPTEPQ